MSALRTTTTRATTGVAATALALAAFAVAPATPADAKGLLKAAIRDDCPVLFIEGLRLYNVRGEVPEGDYTVPIGQATIAREGRDVSIIAYSRMTMVALDAARHLAERGIEAEVVDLRSLRPLDAETVLTSVKKTGRAVIVEEGWPTYGVTAEIAARIAEGAFDYLDAPVVRIGSVEVPMPYAPNLEEAVLPHAEDIVRTVEDLVHRRR